MWFWLLLSLIGPSKLEITVQPLMALASNATFHIQCRVPRDEKNRSLQFGIANTRVSTRQIDGIAGPAVFDLWITDVLCGEDDAFCAVTDNLEHTRLVSRPIAVIGCDDAL